MGKCDVKLSLCYGIYTFNMIFPENASLYPAAVNNTVKLCVGYTLSHLHTHVTLSIGFHDNETLRSYTQIQNYHNSLMSQELRSVGCCYSKNINMHLVLLVFHTFRHKQPNHSVDKRG